MERPVVILLCMAGVLAAGLGLSAYAGVVVLEDITVLVSSVSAGAPLELTATIPPGTGVFAMDIQDYNDGMDIQARVLGPLGYEAASARIDSAQYEGSFAVDEEYEYVLVIESGGAEPVSLVAALGPMPDPSKNALGFVSLYMLVIGVAGMIISAAYMIWSRRRDNQWRGRETGV